LNSAWPTSERVLKNRSDGKTFEVPNHDVALVKKNTIEVGTNLDANSWAEKYVECAILRITSIEDIPSPKAA
jgi:hypothetical protein